MDARKDLGAGVDAFGGAGAQRIKRAAPGAVDAGESEDMDRDTMLPPESEPGGFCRDACCAARTGRPQFRTLVDPAAVARAVDTGRGEIAKPSEFFESRDLVGVHIERRIAGCVG